MKQDVSASQVAGVMRSGLGELGERSRARPSLQATSSEEVKAAFVLLLLAACLLIILSVCADLGSKRDPTNQPMKSAQHTVNKD